MFYLSVYENKDELKKLFGTDVSKDFSFSTGVPGGFIDCSLTVPTTLKDYFFFDTLLNRHSVVFDKYGQRVFEGVLSGYDKNFGEVGLTLSGYYADAKNKTFGILNYPISTPATNAKIIQDAVDVMPNWELAAHPGGTYSDVTPQEFKIDTKVMDVIEKMCGYGYTDSRGILSPMYFVIYDNRIPRFGSPYDLFTTHAEVRISQLQNDFGSAVTMDGVYNKIQTAYTNSDGVEKFLDWAMDKESIDLYGELEGTINAGSNVPDGLAQVAQELGIKYLAFPQEQIKFTITGKIKSRIGDTTIEPYMLRAGQYLYIADLERPKRLVSPEYSYNQYLETSMFSLILSTDYSIDKNSVSVEIGLNRSSLDFYLTNMGVSGSVK